MVDLTVIILTKNEEKNLRKCIESFQGIIKRFVVVDSYSTDGTEALCKQLNIELNKIGSSLDFFQNKFLDHASQLNWGLAHTEIHTDWTMRMDADEELSNELAVEIDTSLPKLNIPINGVVLRRRVYFMGRWIKHGGRYPELLLRIFRTNKGVCENKVMDEHIILLEGTTVNFKYDFIDNNQNGLNWWTNKHNWYSNREVLDFQKTVEEKSSDENLLGNKKSSKQASRKRFIKNNGYYSLPMFWRSHIYFIYRYYFKLGFLDGKEGKIFHFLQAYWYRFLVDAKMYECNKFDRDIEAQGDLK